MKPKFSLSIIFCGLLLFCIQTSCKFTAKSSDGRYEAGKEEVTSYPKSPMDRPPMKETSFVVREIGTKRIILCTRPKYETPNDVKYGKFSPDSKKFAGYYHYGSDTKHGYTWIGVWSLETKELLYSIEEPGWIEYPSEEFPEKKRR